MNLTFHHFCKDVRQFRLILLVWLGLLGLGLISDLGWVGGVRDGQLQNSDSYANVWVGALTFFLWLLFFLLPSAVVLADSPSRREGFLRTRPLPGRDLFLAKALFVVLLVILPALLQELLYLAVSGVRPGYLLHGLAERLGFALPMTAMAAAFASLWRSFSRWAAALIITVVGTYVFALVMMLLVMLTGHLDMFSWESGVTAVSRLLAALYVGAAAAIGLAVLHARNDWKPVARWLGIALCMGVFFLVNTFWPVDFFIVRPADPAAAQAVLKQSPFNVSPAGVQLTRMFGKGWDNRLDFAANLSLQADPAISPNIIEWSGRKTALVNAAGMNFSPVRPPAPSNRIRNFGNPPSADMVAWLALLPKEAFFRLGQNFFPTTPFTSLGEFKLDPHQTWLNDPVTLKAQLEGWVYRWDQVADFSVKLPSSASDPYGTWTFLAWHPADKNDPTHVNHLLLKRSQVNFSTTTDERTRGFSYGPEDRFDFVLYNPRRNLALVTGNSYSLVTTRAGSTALTGYWLDLSFTLGGGGSGSPESWQAFSKEEMAECRLLVLQKTWLGTVSAAWQSDGMVIKTLLAQTFPNPQYNQDGLSRSEVSRRLAELTFPGSQATRSEVCRYLLQALPVMDAIQSSQTPGQEAIARLATLVPGHLDVFLDGLPAMQSPSRRAVIQAIIQGAEESQKKQLIAAIQSDPTLISILFKRGWVAEAHDAIYRLMDSPRPLPFEAIQAIASFHDPQTYPRLLTELETEPRTDVYDMLRNLPGIEAPLAASVNRLWQNQNHLASNNLEGLWGVLGLAMHAGNPEALKFAYRLLMELNGSSDAIGNSWALTQVFRNNVRCGSLNVDEIGNNVRMVEWLRKHTADEFEFDHVRLKFVLKNPLVEKPEVAMRLQVGER